MGGSRGADRHSGVLNTRVARQTRTNGAEGAGQSESLRPWASSLLTRALGNHPHHLPWHHGDL